MVSLPSTRLLFTTACLALDIPLILPWASFADNFHSIDWIHDSLKHSLRTRRLRNRIKTDGLRGLIANLWDGSQGWLLVTLVGFFTACIAFLIISSEMLLFDLKEGYCSTNPSLAKRFCCRASTTTPIPFPPLSDFLSVRGAAPRTSFLNGWKGQTSAMVETCEHWRTWGEVWSKTAASGRDGLGDSWLVDYIAFIVIAVSPPLLSSSRGINLMNTFPALLRYSRFDSHHLSLRLHLSLLFQRFTFSPPPGSIT